MPDLGELGELENLNAMVDDESAGKTFLNRTGINNYRRSLRLSPTPSVLLDSQLRIRWINRVFEESFGPSSEVKGIHLTQYFHNGFNDEKKKSLYLSLTSEKDGYSWYGRVEKKSKSQVSIITNLLILPLFSTGGKGERPVGYQGIFDDISAEYRQMLQNTYRSLLGAARLKDNDTGNHIERVNKYSSIIAEAISGSSNYPEIDHDFIENIGYLAAMHDVGKIGTPDDILNKAGPLEAWEWEVMKEHTLNGAYIMANYPEPMAKEIALRHHEHWNGSGYPHGISGPLIPLCARIVTIADVYDALRMKRAYKNNLTHETAREIIHKDRGTQFDPLLVDEFERAEKSFERIYEELKDPS